MEDIAIKSANYKLTLAHDLILYLCSVLTYNMNRPQSSQFLGDAMETWTRRVTKHLAEINMENVKQLAATSVYEEDTEDVIAILVQAHSEMPNILRHEFVDEILLTLQKNIIEKKD